jgi:4-amino-4-deoxychorismate lyase
MLINGVPGDSISANDRGLLYGDGIFRTMRVHNGLLQNWSRHYAKLLSDCAVLNLQCPSEATLSSELRQLIQHQPDGIAKIIITRGPATRGYAPPPSPTVTRILGMAPTPDYPESFATQGVRLHICQLKLARQPRLAGVKHLNRLENVLAAAEWDDPDIAEGLLFDTSGELIEGTRSNVFLLRGGALFTPDLASCGVAGVQRERVLDWAQQQGVPCHISKLTMADVLAADEIFLVNSVIGLWPVREMPGFKREQHPISLRIQDWLKHEIH